MNRIASFLMLSAILVACGSPPLTPAPSPSPSPSPTPLPPPGATLLWDPDAHALNAFPDDALTRVDPTARTGLRLDLRPEELGVFSRLPENYQQVMRDMSVLDGFGLTAGLFLRFDKALDPKTVPSGDGTADLGAAIVLGVDTEHALVPLPYAARLIDEGKTLLVEPTIPLPPRARAFLAVSDRVRAAGGERLAPSTAMEKALRGEGGGPRALRVAPRIAATARRLPSAGAGQLVSVTVFTTQSVYEDELAIAADIAARTPLVSGVTCTSGPRWRRCDGRLDAVDYRDATGVIPEVHRAPDASRLYSLPFTVWLPPAAGAAPVLVFGHGLGGSRQDGEALADLAAPLGIATAAIDAPSHGEHPTALPVASLMRTLDFFGIDLDSVSMRPFLLREHLRGAAFDKLQLLRALSGRADLDGDGSADVDPTRIFYVGVSLGGILGPELLALAPQARAAVLVVPGGRVSGIVADSPTFRPLVDLLRPPQLSEADVDRIFPLLQTILDRGEPAVWGAHLLLPPSLRPAGLPASAPNLLFAMVVGDSVVPNSSNRALASALQIPLVPPVRLAIDGCATAAPAPVLGNLPDGRTAGLIQFDTVTSEDGSTVPATHGNVSTSPEGRRAWSAFLESAAAGAAPWVVNPYVH